MTSARDTQHQAQASSIEAEYAQIKSRIIVIEDDLKQKSEDLIRSETALSIGVDEWSPKYLRLYVDEANLRCRISRIVNETAILSDRLIRLQRQEDELQASLVSSVADLPEFDVNSYKVSFPFFAPNGERYLTVLNRDDVFWSLKNVSRDMNSQKFKPIIISTSRGMGKTFLLKMIGEQKYSKDMQSPKVVDAIQCGRILSFDFNLNIVVRDEDAPVFLTRLMIFYLCRIFNGSKVDGINWLDIKSIASVTTFVGTASFNKWKSIWLNASPAFMIPEYIRLTNIAFRCNLDCLPVFLLDEVQALCDRNMSQSYVTQDNTRLLTILKSLVGPSGYPVCVCTGTNSGRIFALEETSSILPISVRIGPLSNPRDYLQNWDEMTNYFKTLNPASGLSREKDQEIVMCLIHGSYKVPRLLSVAHNIWSTTRSGGYSQNMEYFIQAFENEAKIYYSEMKGVWTDFSTVDLTNLILCCGCGWEVFESEKFVPGTQLKWEDLISRSLIFPSGNGKSFLFPYTLIWSSLDEDKRIQNMKNAVTAYVTTIVPNLDLKDLFLSYDRVCGADPRTLGTLYEKLFSSGLAARYYVFTQSLGLSGLVHLSDLLKFRGGRSVNEVFSQAMVDFSQGISLPASGASVAAAPEVKAVIHNINRSTAHHDIILPTSVGAIPVQAKASFSLSAESTFQSQLLVDKGSSEEVKALIWLYLGHKDKEEDYPKVVFLSGKEVCSSHEVDLLEYAKHLRSANNKEA